MRTSQAYQFDEFPSDGQLWWIRWFDYITPHHKETGTAGVTVYFSSISDEKLGEIQKARHPDSEFRKYQKTAEISKTHVQASNIPGLTIGSAFRNGDPQFLFSFSEVVINCDTEASPQQLIKSSKPYHSAPEWWKRNTYLYLNQFEHKLANGDDSWLCVLRSGTTDFLIPCPEILRYFYCWHSIMAIIFTTGPWKINFTKAINPKEDRTGIDVHDENLWHLTARKGFFLEHCKLLAPLFFDETGIERANEIFTYSQEKSANGASPIKARIPFRDGPIQLRVKGSWLQKGNFSKFLVFQILGHEWPYPRFTLDSRLDTDNRKGKIQCTTDKRPPFSNVHQAVSFSNKKNADIISSENDPQKSMKVNFPIQAPDVSGLTEIHIEKKSSFIYTKLPPHLVPTTTEGDRTSTGDPSTGGTDQAADFVPIETSDIDRFDMLIEALDKLKSEGFITKYIVVSPPDEKPVMYNKLTLWKMPKIRGIIPGKLAYPTWALLKKDFNRRPRGALIVNIKIIQWNIYIMEIETQSNVGSRALIFKPVSQSLVKDAINDALIHAVSNSGTLKKYPEISETIAVARGWRHTYEYKKVVNQSNMTVKERVGLSRESLMEAIMEVMEG